MDTIPGGGDMRQGPRQPIGMPRSDVLAIALALGGGCDVPALAKMGLAISGGRTVCAVHIFQDGSWQ